MRFYFIAALFVLFLAPVNAQLNSCGILGRVGCIASCAGQNCATGYCKGPGDRKICTCSRCKNGPINPPIPGRG